jgi:xanthine dehydrogenase accessory factor
MKEIKDIISSYDLLLSKGKRAALATVVHVEGSSYRRPGARMLVAEDGQLTGAISGGCLEGDAMRKALLVINQQQPSLITYDTSAEDDATIGIGLGCNGIIKILLEPIKYDDSYNPITLLKRINEFRQEGVIITAFSTIDKKSMWAGTKYFVNAALNGSGNIANDLQKNTIEKAASNVLVNRKNEWLEDEDNGTITFLQYIPPSIRLVVLGAGNDVQPLIAMSDLLGWDTIVMDGRANYAKKERFAKSCEVIVAKPEQVMQNIEIDDFTCFALMTHNYNYDKAILLELSKYPIRYIAMLGPKKKLERMLSEYKDEGTEMHNDFTTKIHSPAGLDIGAETSEEIALSITAEIKAVMSNKAGLALKEKIEGIHK